MTYESAKGCFMAQGICKIVNGWGNQDSAWIRYSDGKTLEITEDRYRTNGYQPPFEDLPECQGGQKDFAE
jgi:hypothetical protein